MMPIPIIFFHYGNSDYLKYSLKQARYFNPDAEIYLIGDKSNNKYSFVKHVMATDFSDAGAEFTPVYKHQSPNSYNYELNCFLRWFYIRDFCRANNIEAFIYLDSDVLVFQDFTKLVPLFNNARIANTCEENGVPAFTYFRDYQTISSFCDYMVKSYSEPASVAKLDSIYESFKNDPEMVGGISDMILFHLYFHDHPEGALKVDFVTEDIAIDSNIKRPDIYEMENGFKKIYWKAGLPYGKNAVSGKLIRFAALHYQGNAKDVMRQHYTSGGYRIAKYLENKGIKDKVKRAKKSIKSLFKDK